jgi:hypothetical protein
MMRCLFLLLLLACSKEPKFSKEELLLMALKADPSATVLLPKSINEGVSCSDYPAGCLSAHLVQVRKLDFIAIEFSSQAEAKLAAQKIRGWYARNWVFDDVTGEPTLERFVQSALEAKKP